MKLIVELETGDEYEAAVKMGWIKRGLKVDRIIYDVPPYFEPAKDVREGWSLMKYLRLVKMK